MREHRRPCWETALYKWPDDSSAFISYSEDEALQRSVKCNYKHKHRDSYRDQNGVLIGSEDYKNLGQKDSEEGDAPGAKGQLLSMEGTNLQRAHSFRAQRRTPGESEYKRETN